MYNSNQGATCFFCDHPYTEITTIKIQDKELNMCIYCYGELYKEILTEYHNEQFLDSHIASHTNQPSNHYTLEQWHQAIENLRKEKK
jgi:hypothetical protein